MDKFIIKKRKLDEDKISSNLNIESTSGESNQASSSSTGLYNISYLAMGFTWYGNKNCSQPECIVCGVKLSNAIMAPNKLKIWKKRVQKNQFEMFPSLSVTQESSEVIKFVAEHLTALEESLDKYFPDLDISEYDWINDPFDKNISLTEFSLEEEELAEIRNNRTLLSKYKNVRLNEF
ncbi:hypothetical protein QTP88_021116 [Uroleucon formosanum]